jgi:hypothetical protein
MTGRRFLFETRKESYGNQGQKRHCAVGPPKTANHEVIIHENTSATSAATPHLGNYIAKETLATEAFVSAQQ